MCMAYTLLEPHGHRAELGKEVTTDSHCVNLKETEFPFLLLKPRLLKCTTLDIEGMGTKQRCALPSKMHLLDLPRIENDGAGIKS